MFTEIQKLLFRLVLSIVLSAPGLLLATGFNSPTVKLRVVTHTNQVKYGSGFFIDENRILTSFQLAKNAKTVSFWPGAHQVEKQPVSEVISNQVDFRFLASVSRVAPKHDLAELTTKDFKSLDIYPVDKALPAVRDAKIVIRSLGTLYPIKARLSPQMTVGQLNDLWQPNRFFKDSVADSLELVPLTTTVFDGMSGSPVIVNDKVIGLLISSRGHASALAGESRDVAWMVPMKYLDALEAYDDKLIDQLPYTEQWEQLVRARRKVRLGAAPSFVKQAINTWGQKRHFIFNDDLRLSGDLLQEHVSHLRNHGEYAEASMASQELLLITQTANSIFLTKEVNDLNISFTSLKKRNDQIHLSFLVRSEKTTEAVFGGNNGGRLLGTIYDQDGAHFRSARGKIGTIERPRLIQFQMVGGVPLRGTIIWEKIPVSTRQIKQLIIMVNHQIIELGAIPFTKDPVFEPPVYRVQQIATTRTQRPEPAKIKRVTPASRP